jgi:hypothetical protein
MEGLFQQLGKANDKQVSQEIPAGHGRPGRERTGGTTDSAIERRQRGNNASGL